MSNCCKDKLHLGDAIRCFKEKTRDWNKEVYGNIFHHKKVILKRLKGIQQTLGVTDSIYLRELQKDLQSKYENITLQEEILWC